MQIFQKQKKKSSLSKSLDMSLLNASNPYGVQPMGNFYLKMDRKNIRVEGLGYLTILSDFTILAILEFMEAEDLLRVLLVSKTFYAFGTYDELWMNLMIKDWEDINRTVHFENSWRHVFLNRRITNKSKKERNILKKPINLNELYSDLLYQKFYCSNVEINPLWIRKSNIPRESAKTLTIQDFIERYEKLNLPVIITDVVTEWKAYGKWNRNFLEKTFKDETFAAGPIKMTFSQYFEYARNMHDECPLFIFDSNFDGNSKILLEDFETPKYFKFDFFEYLKIRPNFRWLLVGGKRSGSKWHIDPNCTHAWNAVIQGKKRWIMLPRDIVPPGVFPSTDMSEVIQPLSIYEWYINFYKETQTKSFFQKYGMHPYECTVNAGELIFVPHESWHLVLNLEDDTIAVTQNFVDITNLNDVRNFLRFKEKQISGLSEERKATLAQEFDDLIGKYAPECILQSDPSSSYQYFRQNSRKKICSTYRKAKKKKSNNCFNFSLSKTEEKENVSEISFLDKLRNQHKTFVIS